MFYSLPYILLIVFFLIISTIQLGIPIEEKSRKYINFFVVLAYVFFWGFRGFIGSDWTNYYVFFSDLQTNSAHAFQGKGFETGFVLYSIIIKMLFANYEIFILINTITNVCLLHIFFKRHLPTKYYALGFVVFMVFYGSTLEFNLLRNFKGMFIFLLALPYIENRKPLKYFTLIFIAFLFHWSSIFYVPMYFFLHKKIPLKIFLITFTVGCIIYLFKIQYITPIIKLLALVLPSEISIKILDYIGNAYYARSYGFTFGFFERTLTTFILLFYYNKITSNRSNILFLNAFFIFISLYLFCSEITIILERVASNFAFSYWILIPIIIQQTERNVKPLLYIFFSFLFISKVFIMMNSIIYDYDSFLFGEFKPYKQRLEIFEKTRKRTEKLK